MRVGFGMTSALAVTVASLGAYPLTTAWADTAAHPRPTSQATPPVGPGFGTARPEATLAMSLPIKGSSSLVVDHPPVQPVEPHTVIVGRILPGDHQKIQIDTPKGEHVWTASALLDHNLPAAAMRAYKKAARAQDALDPACGLQWTLLAGIGRVESDHGRYGGSVLGSDGFSRPAILGVELNGSGPVAAIPDTDHGRWDGDTVWDRAVGPMQFIPSTWASWGRDGDGDGVKSPNDINDAALAAAGYLCANAGTLRTVTGMDAAVFRYNPSDYYVSLVTAFARGYQTGTFVIPSPPAPTAPARGHTKSGKAGAKPHHKAHAGKSKGPSGKATGGKSPSGRPSKSPKGSPSPGGGTSTSTSSPSGSPSSGGSPSGGPSSGSPSPSGSPSSSQSPSGPTSTSTAPAPLTGTLQESNGSYTVGTTPVDVSKIDPATLSSLVGKAVVAQVQDGTTPLLVTDISAAP